MLYNTTISPRKNYQIVHHSMMIIFIFIILSTTLFSASSSIHNFPIAKPNCVDRCGDVSIPYPAGITPECYHDPVFRMSCDRSSGPAKLFWQDSPLQIIDISLDGQATIMHPVGRDCYARNGTRVENRFSEIFLTTYLSLNNTANKFTMVGCDGEATISGRRHNGRKFMTGCSAMCESKDDLKEGSCMGLGCCQTSIPDDTWDLTVELKSHSNYTNVWDFNNCSYAFVVEDSAFRFFPENLTSFKSVETLPLVLNWVIGSGTCAEAQLNSSSYACVSPHSGCYEPENGHGYRCRCHQGYQGSPYLSNGCQDIDECADPTLNDCTIKGYCTNTAGNYTCSCPNRSSGNGRGRDGCLKKQDKRITYILIGTAFGTTILLLATILVYMELKRRSLKRMKDRNFVQNGGEYLQKKLTTMRGSTNTVKIFTSSDLQKATNNFDISMKIGQGGFATVYKGLLPDNTVVAIKKSKEVDPNQNEQFINEVCVLSQVNHRNVVKLLGCCLETEVPLLVYEFINNGTLSTHLRDPEKARLLHWEMRLKIAAETAGVLLYLHSAALPPIIHRDVKSDNILLDQTFTTKVSDFGGSKLVPLDLTHLLTVVQGTFGYLDPEYFQTSRLTEKSDVYSFGVVLLELLTGRKALNLSPDVPEEEKNLVTFFLYIVRNSRLGDIIDTNNDLNRNIKQISEVARLADRCLNMKGEDRPTMKEVATELERLRNGGEES